MATDQTVPQAPTTDKPTKLWLLNGAFSGFFGATLGYRSTRASGDDLCQFLAVPFGFVLALCSAMFAAWIFELRDRTSDEDFTRTELTFGGALIFVAIALAIALLRNRFDLP